MNKNYNHLPRLDAGGLATGSILALIVAMAISLTLDIRPTLASTTTKAAQNASAQLIASRTGRSWPVAQSRKAFAPDLPLISSQEHRTQRRSLAKAKLLQAFERLRVASPDPGQWVLWDWISITASGTPRFVRAAITRSVVRCRLNCASSRRSPSLMSSGAPP
jgi:hypothetical protein